MPADAAPPAVDRAAQVERVLILIEAGKSERAACAEVGINRQTFRSSVLRVDSASHYVRACEALARDQVDKIEEVIEEMREGTITPEVARIELDARKWTASRLFRKTWGDKGSVEHSGPNGGPIEYRNLSEEEVDARIAAALAGGTAAPTD